MENKGISVIICCYNSANRLPETIKHIALQQISSDIEWELIIINNNSTDNTKEIANLEINQYPSLINRYIIIDEPIPGLSNARCKGVKSSKHEYILFCDDDNWLKNDYLQLSFDNFNKEKNIGIIGGKGIAKFEETKPIWFDKYQQYYAVGKQTMSITNSSFNMHEVYGAGMIARKQILLKIYNSDFQHLATDRKGSQLSSGGDTELCILTKLMGYKIIYNPNLVFYHFIPKERLQLNYLYKLIASITCSSTLLSSYKNINKTTNHLIWLYRSIYWSINYLKIKYIKKTSLDDIDNNLEISKSKALALFFLINKNILEKNQNKIKNSIWYNSLLINK